MGRPAIFGWEFHWPRGREISRVNLEIAGAAQYFGSPRFQIHSYNRCRFSGRTGAHQGLPL